MNLDDFVSESGRVNSMKLREAWLEKHASTFFSKVKEYAVVNNIQYTRPVEAIWYYLNKISNTHVCKNPTCTNSTKFIGLTTGYLEYCSYSCSNNSIDVKAKKIATSIERYGVENPYQAKEVIDKIKATNFSRYGVDNPMRSDKIKDGMISRSLERTGKKWALSSGGTADISKKKRASEDFSKKYSDLTLLEYSEQKFGECKFNSLKCGHDFYINKWQLHQRNKSNIEACTICNPIGSFNETAWQLELSSFLTELGISFRENDRKVLGNLELDFYIPENKCAIELNGLYWHSINFKNHDYHLNKTERCEDLGIQLIHIFEDEWIYSKEIVLSRLKNILNRSDVKIYARNCEVKEITGAVSKSFIDSNHLQGNIPASKRYGLFHNNELVSVMTFGALRRALGSTPISGEYEMYRFCNKANYSIVGGASKLLTHFIKTQKPTQIISYADRRWSTGKLYKSLGFSLVRKTPPNFWYVINDRRVHRFNYTNKKIKSLGVNPELTRIYDSGNLRFSLVP